MEEWAEDMCWSWNAEDIDPDKDDGKVWIPMMPKTLDEEAGEAQGLPHTPSGVCLTKILIELVVQSSKTYFS